MLTLHGTFVPHVSLLISFVCRRSFPGRVAVASSVRCSCGNVITTSCCWPSPNGKVAPSYSFSEFSAFVHPINILDLSCGVDEHRRKSGAVLLIIVTVVTIVDVG
jgi:hypothetical protein